MTKQRIFCSRCKRRFRGHGEWNAELVDGVAVSFLCPDCQTPDENAEAAINEATTDYGHLPDGRVIGHMRGDA
jgi:hypothetical protein